MVGDQRGSSVRRAELVEIARALRNEGASLKEIAAILGKSVTTVSGYLTDPDLSKQRARRDRYRNECATCGKLIAAPAPL
jgi:predicted transcriptional regulator